MADRENATGVLGLVQAFVNTVDLQDGPEELTDPNTLRAWLDAHGLMEPGSTASEAGLKHAIALREAIFRSFAATAAGGAPPEADFTTLNEALAAAPARRRLRLGGWEIGIPVP